MKNLKFTSLVSLSLPLYLTLACGGENHSDLTSGGQQGFVVRSDKGRSLAEIQDTVEQYRKDLGGANNLNAVGTQAQGHREINWDGVPADKSAPNLFPGDFFKTRGLLVSAPCDQLQVSSSLAESPKVEFSNIKRNLSQLFKAFSPEKLFAPLGSNTLNVTFTVPGSKTPATVSGFGAIFSDVDLARISKIEYFDMRGKRIAEIPVEAVEHANESFSFVGLNFKNGQRIAKVRITTGNVPLQQYSQENARDDLVVVDDFLYAEPAN